MTDLTTGTELVASFTTSPQGGADSPGVKSSTDTHHHDDKEAASVTMVIKKTDKSIPQLSPQHGMLSVLHNNIEIELILRVLNLWFYYFMN